MRTQLTRFPRLPRLPWPRSILRVGGAAALALAAGSWAASTVARADDLAKAYGARSTVVVAAHELAPGTTVGEGDLRTVELPDALVAGTPVGDPLGRTVAARVLAGEVVAAERLAPDGVTGPMALAPSGSRALALANSTAPPPLRLGDRVDVLAASVDGARTVRAASRAVVVDVGEETTTVAVRPDEVDATARAVLDGSAVLALRAD